MAQRCWGMTQSKQGTQPDGNRCSKAQDKAHIQQVCRGLSPLWPHLILPRNPCKAILLFTPPHPALRLQTQGIKVTEAVTPKTPCVCTTSSCLSTRHREREHNHFKNYRTL